MFNMNIVQTNVPYNSTVLRRNLIFLTRKYPFLNVQIIGNSVLGNNIYAIKLGKGPKKVFYSGSIHGNEWITSTLLMKFIEDYCDSYVSDKKLYNYSIKSLFDSASIFVVPMINPDGVDLVTNNLFKNSAGYRKALAISQDFPSIPFPDGWKANINGVDLKNYQPFRKVL